MKKKPKKKTTSNMRSEGNSSVGRRLIKFLFRNCSKSCSTLASKNGANWTILPSYLAFGKASEALLDAGGVFCGILILWSDHGLSVLVEGSFSLFIHGLLADGFFFGTLVFTAFLSVHTFSVVVRSLGLFSDCWGVSSMLAAGLFKILSILLTLTKFSRLTEAFLFVDQPVFYSVYTWST